MQSKNNEILSSLDSFAPALLDSEPAELSMRMKI